MNLPFAAIVTENGPMPRPVNLLNAAFTNTFGYVMSDVPTVGEWFRLAYPDDAYRMELLQTWEIDVRTAFATQGIVPTRELQIQTKSGQAVRALVSAQAMNHYLITTFVDVSQQRRTEAELRDVRFQLERTAYELTENLPVGTYTMVQPPDGGLAQFRFMSTRFLELTGLDREQAFADPLKGFACVHPDDYDRWLELNAMAFANREAFFGETRVIVKGEVRWITAESKPRPLPDGSTVWEGVLIDITERKLAEQSLAEAKARAEKLERVKSDFLMQMSHEIRTPLTAILGLADLLARDELDDRQHNKVDQIRNSGKLLLGIVNDILDLSKIEAGQLITEEQPFTLQALLPSIQTLQATITQPNLKFRLDMPNQPLPTLIGDRRRIEQVLSNLVGNAIKYTTSGEIQVSVTELERRNQAVKLRFSVQDTGQGISPAVLPELFRPFVQGDSGIARQFGGTGLGLSISKQLVELMGGEIHVKSQLGVGSTFWFDLPLALHEPLETSNKSMVSKEDRTGEDRTGTTTRGNRLSGIRILVVDDSPVIRDLIDAFLTSEGALVELAEDGVRALDVLGERGGEFDCVMMDVQMPVMDGLSAVRQMRTFRRLDHLPVLAMTAGLLAEQQVKARAAGMVDVVAKPVNVQRMVTQIADAVGHARKAAQHPSSATSKIPNISGIEADHVRRTMDGNGRLFERLSVVFIDEFEGLDTRLQTLMAAGFERESVHEAIRLTHSLRGAASQLGAVELSEAAADLERAYETRASDHEDKRARVGQLLAELIDSLKTHHGQNGAPTTPHQANRVGG